MFSYNRPNRKTTFWIDSGDRYPGDWSQTGAIEAIAAIIWEPAYTRLDRFKYLRRAVVSDAPESDNRVLARYSETKRRTSIAERVSWLPFVIAIVGDDIFPLKPGSWSHIRAKTLTSVKEFIITGCQERGEQLKMRLGYW